MSPARADSRVETAGEFQVKKSDVDQHVVRRNSQSPPERVRCAFALETTSGSLFHQCCRLWERGAWSARPVGILGGAQDVLTLEIAGAQTEQLGDVNRGGAVDSVEGAELLRTNADESASQFRKNESEAYPRERIVIHFSGKTQ